MKNKDEKKLNGSKVLKRVLVVIGVFLLFAIIFFCYATYKYNSYLAEVSEIENIPVKLIAENGKEFGETTYKNYLEIKDKHPQLYDIFDNESKEEVVEYANYILEYLPEVNEDVIKQTASKNSGFNIGSSIRRLSNVPEYNVVKWNLVTYGGKEFGKVSLKCIDAIYSGEIDAYIPLNIDEKETLNKYKEYIRPHRLKEIYYEMPEDTWVYEFSLF